MTRCHGGNTGLWWNWPMVISKSYVPRHDLKAQVSEGEEKKNNQAFEIEAAGDISDASLKLPLRHKLMMVAQDKVKSAGRPRLSGSGSCSFVLSWHTWGKRNKHSLVLLSSSSLSADVCLLDEKLKFDLSTGKLSRQWVQRFWASCTDFCRLMKHIFGLVCMVPMKYLSRKNNVLLLFCLFCELWVLESVTKLRYCVFLLQF